MSVEQTIYEVTTRYELQDRGASSSLGQIAGQADRAGTGVAGVTSQLKGLAAVIGGGLALHKGKQLFIDYNNSIDQLERSLTAVIQMDMGGSFEAARGKARGLVAELQPMGRSFIQFGNTISTMGLRAGASLEQLGEVTKRGVVAARVFGIDEAQAANSMRMLLAGKAREKDEFLQRLGVDVEALNKASPAARMESLIQTLRGPAMRDAATAYEASFAGVMSTIEDNIEVIGGRVGKPLFAAITAEIQSWNTWIEKNPEKIEKFATTFAGALRDGLGIAKQTARYLIDNKDTLITIGKVWLAAKGVGALGASMANVAGSFGILGRNAASAATGLGGFTTKVTSAASTLGLLIVGFEAFMAWLNRDLEKRIGAQGDVAYSMDVVTRARRSVGGIEAVGAALPAERLQAGLENRDITALALAARDMGAITKEGGLDRGKVETVLQTAGYLRSKEELAANPHWAIGKHRQAEQLVELMAFAVRYRQDLFQPNKERDEQGTKGGKGGDGKPVHLNVKVAVATSDPDRFVFRLAKTARKVARNPGMAKDAFREGLG